MASAPREMNPTIEELQSSVEKSSDAGMLEVAEEESQLIQQEECYVLEQQKNQQKAERQRQISLMYRYEDEKRTRVDEQSSAEENRRRAMEKSEIRSFARHILNDLIPNVFVRLQDSGFFRDPISVEMEEEFLPWLVNNIGQSLDEYYAISLVTQGMIRTALKENRNQTYQSMLTARSMLPMPEKRGRIKRNVAQQNGLS